MFWSASLVEQEVADEELWSRLRTVCLLVSRLRLPLKRSRRQTDANAPSVFLAEALCGQLCLVLFWMDFVFCYVIPDRGAGDDILF